MAGLVTLENLSFLAHFPHFRSSLSVLLPATNKANGEGVQKLMQATTRSTFVATREEEEGKKRRIRKAFPLLESVVLL